MTPLETHLRGLTDDQLKRRAVALDETARDLRGLSPRADRITLAELDRAMAREIDRRVDALLADCPLQAG